MLILAVDQSSSTCGLALLDDERVLAEDFWPESRFRGQDLYTRVPTALARIERAVAQVELFAVGLGPGAFAALRASLTYLQALALPDRKPVIGVESAAALAWDVGTETGESPVAVVGDARRERFWAARFESLDARGLPLRADYSLLQAAELPDFLDGARVAVTPHWERMGETLKRSAPTGLRTVEGSRSPLARTVGRIAWRRHIAGVTAANPQAPLKPVYLFPPVSVPPRFPANGAA
jgi:tRNA threonylcarbamoyladenosine biosynthesis protein TsaB